MRSRSVSAALVIVLCGGCATGRELRVRAEQGAAIVPDHSSRELAPGAGYMLVNPAGCLHLARVGSGGDGLSELLALVATVGCAGLLTAVDLVALPIQAVRRTGQRQELERIGLVCPLGDPAARVAPDLASRMIREFGFARAPLATATQVAAGDPPASARAVQLRVMTAKYERSSRITWEARVEFRDPGGQRLWNASCESHAPKREAGTFEGECEAARAEIAALADRCVESVTARLRELWPRWEPKRASPTTEEHAPPDGR